MTTHSPSNERIKRRYLTYLKEAKHQSDATVDAVAAALARFETDTGFRDFKAFHTEQAIAFKRRLAEQDGRVAGTRLSKATLYATVAHLGRFFHWLAGQPGYKSCIRYSDADYFSLSANETRVATARRKKPFPTLEQVKRAISLMPHASEVERRNRALVAFILLTGARDSAVASLKLKHIDIAERSVLQDAREVRTKFGKSFATYFFPIGDEIFQIVVEWVEYLREEKFWGNDDPLFPATQIGLGESQQFVALGLTRETWKNTTPIRTIFRNAFHAAGLPYFNPHSLRATLAQLGERVCQTPEDFKAWSQNLGHEGVLTTFCSYGEVGTQRQAEIIRHLGNTGDFAHADAARQLLEFAKVIVRQERSDQAK